MNKHLNAIRKTGFGSLFTPTKAMSRMRAIATDRTQSSLTGGCFEPGIIRISTEFCGAEGDPDPLGAPLIDYKAFRADDAKVMKFRYSARNSLAFQVVGRLQQGAPPAAPAKRHRARMNHSRCGRRSRTGHDRVNHPASYLEELPKNRGDGVSQAGDKADAVRSCIGMPISK